MQIRPILIKDHIYIFFSETAEPNYTKPGRDGPWVDPFQNCVRQPTLRSRWLLLLKIEISSIVHCCFSINQNELKF